MLTEREKLLDMIQRVTRSIRNQAPIIASLATKIGAAAASFGVTFLVAASFGPGAVGTYALFTQSLLVFSMFAVFGSEQLAIRDIAGNLGAGRPGMAYKAARRGARSVLLASSGLALICLGLGFTTINFGFQKELFPMLAIGLVANAAIVYCAAIIRAVNKPILSQLLPGLSAYMMLAFTAVLSMNGDIDAPAVALSMAYTLAGVAIALTAVVIGYRIVGPWRDDRTNNDAPASGNQFKLGIISSLNFASGWSALVIVGFLFGDEGAGIFRVCIQFNMLMMMVIMTYHGIVAPQFAQLNANRDYAGLRRLLRHTQIMLMSMCGIPALILAVFAPFVLGLMGEEFIQGANTLRLLILATLIAAMTGSGGTLLNMSGREDIVLRVTLAAAISETGCLVLGAPFLGISAAAAALVVSFAVRYLGIYFFVLRWLSARIAAQPGSPA